jgi:L,D-peptidoglycan transpeptidase YkuD (ErfK/YbiS/YcfS/YnhG family)
VSVGAALAAVVRAENGVRWLRTSIAVLLLAAAANLAAADFDWATDQQLVRVVTADWSATTGELRRYRRGRDGWHAVGRPIPVNIGRSGSAWGIGLHPPQPGLQKAEGDGRAPAGVFALGSAFGRRERHATRLGYVAVQATDYCVDVIASPLYNRIVDTREVGVEAVAGSTEPMRRDLQQQGDDLYALGFVIEHNPDAAKAAGSCIFAHLWRGPGVPTAGCTAMTPRAMRRLLRWLDRRRQPRLVLMPRAEYAARVDAWALPPLQ